MAAGVRLGWGRVHKDEVVVVVFVVLAVAAIFPGVFGVGGGRLLHRCHGPSPLAFVE